jgi:hypothetical protein
MFEKVLIYVSRKLKRSLYLGINVIFKMIFIVKEWKKFSLSTNFALPSLYTRSNRASVPFHPKQHFSRCSHRGFGGATVPQGIASPPVARRRFHRRELLLEVLRFCFTVDTVVLFAAVFILSRITGSSFVLGFCFCEVLLVCSGVGCYINGGCFLFRRPFCCGHCWWQIRRLGWSLVPDLCYCCSQEGFFCCCSREFDVWCVNVTEQCRRRIAPVVVGVGGCRWFLFRCWWWL